MRLKENQKIESQMLSEDRECFNCVECRWGVGQDESRRKKYLWTLATSSHVDLIKRQVCGVVRIEDRLERVEVKTGYEEVETVTIKDSYYFFF